MALTQIQQEIMASIAKNRSDTSYIAGGLVLNANWPRISDDIDIFHDTDEEIGSAADKDIETLKADSFVVVKDIDVYGCVEATVMRGGDRTLVQWMSETRTRFFPLIRDEEWGARLHRADLAVNKVLAASTRTKPRDFVDLLMIDAHMCRLGPLVMAASGKPPNYSPLRSIDEIRRRGLSVRADEYTTVRGLPEDWTAEIIRDELVRTLDRAESYVRNAPPDLVGILALNAHGVPVEVYDLSTDGIEYRRSTTEHEVVPDLPETPADWS
ncbi:hypothetical protein ABIE78_002704 [Sinorhizobium fredii]|uniref:Uncharacterized protein n=1 Tax=Sinorhizobium fredii (strain USDA 257) TaxID=1185652 RepID=I3X6F9_SINF2|nr:MULTISPECIES: hypothetical protein [Sinorhizobium]AFL51465.1 hypothetical protein USDA257_c28940 [Sinorhizobium fredii USDA 257]PDT81754.1 hypothetical protein CO676_21015 [Sinorhizobium sp. BJ1]